MPVPDAHLYISAYVETRIHTRVYIPRGNGARARTCTYVDTYVSTDSRAARTDGRTDEQRDRRTDGRQICNALTPVLNEMRCGGRETASGRPVGREGVSRGVVPAVVGCGGWPAVGANSHLTNPIINN